MKPPHEPYRIGLIGSGMISRVYLEAMKRVPEGRVVAVWSRKRAHAERLAGEHGIELATDRLADVLAAVDVVCVNSPNALHAEHAIAAAAAGCHVIVEKPLAVSLEEGAAMIAACQQAGVGLAYAEELPFVPKFRRAREILVGGGLGDPRYLTQREAHAGPYSPWFFSRDEAGGGVLMDMACHGIECVRFVLGKPPVRTVTARLDRLRHGERTELEDHAVLHLEFEGGVSATCEASWALLGGMQSSLEIWGSAGTLRADLLHETGLRQFSKDAWTQPLAEPAYENGYPQELSHFLQCFREGREPDESGADGLAVLEILLAAYASAAGDAAIALPFRPEGVERPWISGSDRPRPPPHDGGAPGVPRPATRGRCAAPRSSRSRSPPPAPRST